MATPEAIGEDGHGNYHWNDDILSRSPRSQLAVVGALRDETTLHAAATRPSAEVLIYLGTQQLRRAVDTGVPTELVHASTGVPYWQPLFRQPQHVE